MSIPVYEKCGHQILAITPSKARHWRHTNPRIQPKVEGNWDQGMTIDTCQIYIQIPWDLLEETLSRTQAPTRRRIHPWIDKAIAKQIGEAGLACTGDDDHHMQLTERGVEVLQNTYAKLLRRDLERGFELMAVLTDALRTKMLYVAGPADSWTTVADQALQCVDGVLPGAGRYLRDVPSILVRRLEQFDPYTTERLLNTSH